jgi:hypothetical protein
MKENHLRPVQPGWVIVPVKQDHPNEWYHLVGWEELEPVIAYAEGVCLWREIFGEDRFCVATLDEWQGKPSAAGGAEAVADVVREHPGINSSELRRILYRDYGIEKQPVAITDAVTRKLITVRQEGPARRHYPC